MFFNIGVLQNFANFIKTTSIGVSIWYEFIKETPTQVLLWEIYEMFKNTFFYRTPPVAASVLISV